MKQEGPLISHWIERVTVSITNKVWHLPEGKFLAVTPVAMETTNLVIYYIFFISLLN